MDRISNLPKHILHDILSRLTNEEAVRTSVLCKEWKDTWSTFPILDFAESKFGIGLGNSPFNHDKEEDLRKRNNFFSNVDRTLLWFHDQGIAVKECKITMDSFTSQSCSGRMDHWLKLASESGVEVLDLDLGHRDSIDNLYCLSPSVLEAKSLIKLRLSGFFRIDEAFLKHPIKLASLRELSLCTIYLGDEQVIQKIICCCPLIEYITLDECYELKSIGQEGIEECLLNSVSIRGLPKLKGVKAFQIQEVDVDAPSLEEFAYYPFNDGYLLKANVDRCRNLRKLELSLGSIIITDQWFLELFPKFPLLESLKLYGCIMYERIKVSSGQLKLLELCNCSNLKEINIDAPNICSFIYQRYGIRVPMVSFLNNSSQLEATIRLSIGSYQGFLKLREFLQNFYHQNVPTSLDLSMSKPIDEFKPHMFQETSVPPPNIKHLNLRCVPQDETLNFPLFTCLLWSCIPDTISLQPYPGSDKRVVLKISHFIQNSHHVSTM